MKSYFRLLVLLTMLAGLLAVAVIVFLLRVGVWLAIDDPLPERADVIFTFAGENARLTWSRELTNQYPSSHWVVSDYHGYYERILTRDGYEMGRVSPLDSCPDTYQEVRGLSRWVERHSGDTAAGILPDRSLSVVLVSSPYHMRRIKVMTGRVFGADSHVFYCCPVPLERYGLTARDLRTWWRSPFLREKVVSELEKLVVFWLFS